MASSIENRRIKQREYARAWRTKNPEKAREVYKLYRERNKEKIREYYNNTYKVINHHRTLETKRKWNINNVDKVRVCRIKYYKNNRERCRSTAARVSKDKKELALFDATLRLQNHVAV